MPMKHFITLLLFCLTIGFASAQKKKNTKAEPAPSPTIITHTDGKTRLAQFESHVKMKNESPHKSLRWRFLGPDNISGRITDVEAVAGNKMLIYAATATGGLWKTTNAGITWESLMDDAPTASIGDVALAPSNPNIVYVGTGECNIFRASLAGLGMFRSTNGGKSWEHLGLEETHTISKVLVHPTNPDIVYVAASGNEWTYNPERGVYKTTDGGKTWEKVFYIDEKTGAIDMLIDPNDPNTLYASMWNRIRKRWSDPTPEDGDGIYKTTDGGKTWKLLANGLPDTKFTGRVGISLCRTKPNTVYAYVDNHAPGRTPTASERDSYGRPKQQTITGAEVYRSDDKGESWRKVNEKSMENFGGTYGWVFGQIRVDPNDDNTVYIMGLNIAKSTDGGKNFKVIGQRNVHSDHHAIWIDPTDSDYVINGNDGGVNVSYDGGINWRDFYDKIPTTQHYTLGLDNAKPFNIYTSVQDEGSFRTKVTHRPGFSRGFYNSTRWEGVPGGEGSFNVVDPTDSTIYYQSSFYGRLTRHDFKTGKTTNILPKVADNEPVQRGEWLAATLLSPHNPSVVYHGMQYLYRSMDKGSTWEKISPDLSYNDPNEQGKLPYQISFATITQIAESPKKFGLLYVGTDDGKLHISKNGGTEWKEILKGLPYKKHVSGIVASQYDEATVYLAQNGRRDDDWKAYLFRSTDYGETWTDISANLPGGPVNVIREDPKNKNVLYIGTDAGVYVSKDSGQNWVCLSNNLPNSVSINDIAIHTRDNMMVIATYGRGVWVLNDLSELQK